MPSIQDVIKNYQTLCDFCDSFWITVREQYPDDLLCKKGCHNCCELESVCALEAHMIWNHINDKNLAGNTDQALHDSEGEELCPLLLAGLCTIYQIRPIICRTHGLPIRSVNLTDAAIDCCPINFTDGALQDINANHVLDLDMITDNLMRLNMAFCMLLGDNGLSSERFSLRDIVINRIPDLLKAPPTP